MNKYLDFVEINTYRKTKTFEVKSKSSRYILAVIRWYAPWRQYCFFPMFDTVFNNTCLLDIIEFIKNLKGRGNV
ncbi:MAG: hypothetical protein WC554_02875 [Clostridia bacterium]